MTISTPAEVVRVEFDPEEVSYREILEVFFQAGRGRYGIDRKFFLPPLRLSVPEAIVLFLALVAVGLPLLSGGRGGLGVFFGPTAGFLLSWPVGAFVTGWLTERFWKRLNFAHLLGACAVGGIFVISSRAGTGPKPSGP